MPCPGVPCTQSCAARRLLRLAWASCPAGCPFGRRTIAAKMTDVPGHTRSIISPLAKQGIQYLQHYINDVARMPDAALFIWEDDWGYQLMVHYERGYGGTTVVPGHPEARVSSTAWTTPARRTPGSCSSP